LNHRLAKLYMHRLHARHDAPSMCHSLGEQKAYNVVWSQYVLRYGACNKANKGAETIAHWWSSVSPIRQWARLDGVEAKPTQCCVWNLLIGCCATYPVTRDVAVAAATVEKHSMYDYDSLQTCQNFMTMCQHLDKCGESSWLAILVGYVGCCCWCQPCAM
jgi:hypothetical protein